MNKTGLLFEVSFRTKKRMKSAFEREILPVQLNVQQPPTGRDKPVKLTYDFFGVVKDLKSAAQ